MIAISLSKYEASIVAGILARDWAYLAIRCAAGDSVGVSSLGRTPKQRIKRLRAFQARKADIGRLLDKIGITRPVIDPARFMFERDGRRIFSGGLAARYQVELEGIIKSQVEA